MTSLVSVLINCFLSDRINRLLRLGQRHRGRRGSQRWSCPRRCDPRRPRCRCPLSAPICTLLYLRATVSYVNPQGFGTDDGCAGRTGPGKGGEAAQTRAQATPPAAAAGAALAATWQRAGWPPGPPNSRYLSRLLCACSIFWPDNVPLHVPLLMGTSQSKTLDSGNDSFHFTRCTY